MAMQGEFKDGGLNSIVQMMCLDASDGGLFVERDGEQGAIFFEAGEIVHAMIGKIDGPEAVYRMLSWPEGEFSTVEQAQAPSRTVAESWDILLSEGQRWAEEHNEAAKVPLAG